MRKVTQAVATLVMLLGLAGGTASAASPEVVAAAEREGKVLWYTTMIVNQAVRPLIAAFEAAYPGIKVQYIRAGSSDTVLKVLQEGQAGRMQADLFDAVGGLRTLVAAGDVAAYKPAEAGAFPSGSVDPDGHWTPMVRNYMTLAYNTDMVAAADAPKSFADLLDPKWHGKIGWTTEVAVTGPAGFIGTVLDVMGEQAGMDYLRKLARQDIVPVATSQRGVLDQTIAGERPIALMTYAHHSMISAAQGAPVEWSRFDPVVESFIYLGVTQQAPHPNAARVLDDFILSKQGQSILADAQYVPARDDVPPHSPELAPKGHFKLHLIALPELEAHLADWNNVFLEIFK